MNANYQLTSAGFTETHSGLQWPHYAPQIHLGHDVEARREQPAAPTAHNALGIDLLPLRPLPASGRRNHGAAHGCTAAWLPPGTR